MKKVNLLSLCICACLSSHSLFAQQRSIDIGLILMSPAAADTFTADTTVPFKVSMYNHGPDNLNAGDTLFVVYGNMNQMYTLPIPIPAGDTVPLINIPMNIQTEDQIFTNTVCGSVFDDPTTQVTFNGAPVSVSYKDPNPDNNEICAQITVLAPGSTAVNSVGKTDFGFRLYPNPFSSGNINIKNDKGYTIQEVSIADMTGREVFKLAGNKQSGQSFLLPDYISDGIYLVHVQTAKGEQVLRLQVIH